MVLGGGLSWPVFLVESSLGLLFLGIEQYKYSGTLGLKKRDLGSHS